MTQSKVELVYWPLRGLANPLRVACHIGGIEFTDTYMTPSWFGPDGVKAGLSSKNPLVNLPLLKFADGSMLAQSPAILRWISRNSAELKPRSECEEMRIDEVTEHLKDLIQKQGKVTYGGTAEEREQFIKQHAPTCFGALEKYMSVNGTTYSAANHLTVADVMLFEMVERQQAMQGDPNALSEFPKVMAVHKAVLTHPKAVGYHAKAKELRFNGPGATWSPREPPKA